ncbi:MAG TPA: hypothetical protein VJX67_19400 [Blastocatellia bacterium]|nr:hypothetical protein [Blastocatellia bacterium]
MPGIHARALLTLAIAFAIAVPVVRPADSKKPINKSGLLEAVRLNGLSTKELIERVDERGVSFKLSEADEKEFRDAGARPELIEAIRRGYRPAAGVATGGTDTGGATNPGRTGGRGGKNFSVPPGSPLSENEVITLLQSGVPPERVEQFVEVRGVSFGLTAAITSRIKQAGGSTGLIGAIAEKSMAGGATSGGPTTGPSAAPVAGGADYDQLIDQATAALNTRNYAYATNLLTHAIQVDAGKPAAYTLLDYAALYGSGNLVLAEKAGRAAIERGGGAVFRVYHDHTGSFSSYCTGSFFVSRNEVTFKADNGVDTFEASKETIKEARQNGLVGIAFGAFHVKVGEAGGRTRNYNFAPATKSKGEASLIVRLIEGRQ